MISKKLPKDLEAIAQYAAQYLEPGETINEYLEELKGGRRGKYNNNRNCVIDGIRFDSDLEGDTYLDIKNMKEQKVVLDFKRQIPFSLKSSSSDEIGRYVADFVCKLPNGTLIVVEAKGVETALWKFKKKFFLAEYPTVPLIMVRDRSQFPLSQSCRQFRKFAPKSKYNN